MSFRDVVVSAARAAGGSFQTRAAREQIVSALASYLAEANIQIRTLEQLKGKHIQGFIKAGVDAGLSSRTLQNRLTAIRTTLRSVGLDRKADSIQTRDYEVNGASRLGTRRAITDQEFKERIDHVGDAGVRAALELQRELGLRQNEAIRGGSLDTLRRWERELEKGSRIRVAVGTKGGRPRETLVIDRARALQAVKSALGVSERQQGRLIAAAGLKEARDRFNNQARLAGFVGELSPHSIRYAFACASIKRYEDAGFSHREALAMTSLDLGHGDGRGRWVEHVYSRTS